MLLVALPDNLFDIHWANEVLENILGNLLVIKDIDLEPRGLIIRYLLKCDQSRDREGTPSLESSRVLGSGRGSSLLRSSQGYVQLRGGDILNH